jgi:GntR family transcriptional regulator, transcriptional repressor for pyruvate dehydrogenase complex
MLEPIVRPSTIAEQAQAKLIKYISSSGLKADDFLPSESELSAALGVGRSTIREALKSLEAMGIVARRRGCRTVLQDVDFSCMARSTHPLFIQNVDDLYQLLAARRLHELSILPLVASNATAEDFERMDYFNRMWQASIDEGCPGHDWDREFHRILVIAAHNKFLVQIYSILQEFFDIVVFSLHSENRPDEMPGLEDHYRLTECLRNGDIEGAQHVMGKHLDAYNKDEIEDIYAGWISQKHD